MKKPVLWMLGLLILGWACGSEKAEEAVEAAPDSAVWSAPDTADWAKRTDGDLLRYGRQLVSNTTAFFGDAGSVASLTNGLNCQNCHLDAGTRPFTNNYALVASTYPRFRARSGSVETVHKRIADCFERSLNGKAPDSMSREGQAIAAYVLWVGSGVKPGETPEGAGLYEIDGLDRAANPDSGKLVYDAKCQSCHQANGQGIANGQGGYTFPPLWGDDSYNYAAGLYRLSRFASYVKQGMPLGVDHEHPQLSDTEAWDVAAFVNSQPRPGFDLRSDWPDISGKPADHPFGPWADSFSAEQHKYGPFKPIKAFYKAKKALS